MVLWYYIIYFTYNIINLARILSFEDALLEQKLLKVFLYIKKRAILEGTKNTLPWVLYWFYVWVIYFLIPNNWSAHKNLLNFCHGQGTLEDSIIKKNTQGIYVAAVEKRQKRFFFKKNCIFNLR